MNPISRLTSDLDLFGDDEVDEENEKIKAARVAEVGCPSFTRFQLRVVMVLTVQYDAKKAKKAAKGDVLIAKSNIILDVKVFYPMFV